MVQAEKQMSATKINQLQKIAVALREELEKHKLEAKRLVQEERRIANTEIQQLRNAAATLRSKLEKKETWPKEIVWIEYKEAAKGLVVWVVAAVRIR